MARPMFEHNISRGSCHKALAFSAMACNTEGACFFSASQIIRRLCCLIGCAWFQSVPARGTARAVGLIVPHCGQRGGLPVAPSAALAAEAQCVGKCLASATEQMTSTECESLASNSLSSIAQTSLRRTPTEKVTPSAHRRQFPVQARRPGLAATAEPQSIARRLLHLPRMR